MERYSDRAIEIINELHAERLDYDSEYLPLIDCANRCKAYEDAEEQGRLVWLPFPLHSALLNMSNKERPELLKDFRLSAAWTNCGIVFHSPLGMFIQDVERGYIQHVSEEAEKALKGANRDG